MNCKCNALRKLRIALTIVYSGWVVNTALTELTSEMAKNALGGKIRKDLKAAFELAAEQHPIEYYKDVLKKFEEEMIANQKAAAATPKKSKKAKGKADEDEDVEMADAPESSKGKNKKRKAEDDTNVGSSPNLVFE